MISNFKCEKGEISFDIGGVNSRVYNYHYNNYTNWQVAKQNKLIGKNDKNQESILPVWYLLESITDNIGQTSLSGVTMPAKGTINRQDSLYQLSDKGRARGSIIHLEHEFDNEYDNMAVLVYYYNDKGQKIDIGYIPRHRPNKASITADIDAGTISDYQKIIVADQNEDKRIIVTNYRIYGGYNQKVYNMAISLGRLKE